jgi:(4-(4-[2-(gamma-L-glutamylamino)ethyl]phenoxymethyl)furan-2-yl)methanamine synthase
MGLRWASLGGRPSCRLRVSTCGGANLKYADQNGKTLSHDFPMWRRHRELCEQLIRDLRTFESVASLAITMTGELADCFADRQDGVNQIIDAVEAAALSLGIPRVAYYAIRKGFLNHSEAKSDVDRVAASNWFALATYVAEEVTANGLLVDIGSTTTDIVPIVNGKVGTLAITDYDRLVEGSLVYLGCERTPVCALLSTVEHRGNHVGVMNEFFATVDDSRIVLRSVGESNESDTADGRARTREFASARLARMVGLDRRTFSDDDAISMARQVVDSVKFRISQSLVRMDPNVGCYVISGHGSDLLPTLPAGAVISLVDRLGPELSRCAPSYAVAILYAKAIGVR